MLLFNLKAVCVIPVKTGRCHLDFDTVSSTS